MLGFRDCANYPPRKSSCNSFTLSQVGGNISMNRALLRLSDTEEPR